MYDMNKGNFRDIDGVIAKMRKVNDQILLDQLNKSLRH
jgi:hypothetical protein